MTDPNNRKLLSVLCHASIFLSSTVVAIAVPIIILLVSNDPIVQQNAREAINFHINLYFYAVVVVILFLSIIGIPAGFVLGGILLLISWIMPILAMVETATQTERPYRYPFILHLV